MVRWWRSSPADDKRAAEWNGIIRRILGILIGCVRRWRRLVLNIIWDDVRLTTVQRWLMDNMVSGGGISFAMVEFG